MNGMKTSTMLVAALALAIAIAGTACGHNATPAQEASAPNAAPAASPASPASTASPAGGATSASTPGAESASTEKIDACSVLTLDQIKEAVGRSDFSQGKSRDGGTQCRYASGRGSLTVWVSSATKASFDDFRNLLANEGKKPEPVSGVGDDAYFWDDRLYARIGGHGLTVDLNQNELKSEPSATRREKVLALAKAAAPKLR